MRRLDLPSRINGLLGASTQRPLLHDASILTSRYSAISRTPLSCRGKFEQPLQLRSIALACYPTRRLSNCSRPSRPLSTARPFSTVRILLEAQRPPTDADKGTPRRIDEEPEDNDELAELAFARSEKATQAAKVNLSARLSKEGAANGTAAGFGEVWRLLKIARPEAKSLSGTNPFAGVRGTNAEEHTSGCWVSLGFVFNIHVDPVSTILSVLIHSISPIPASP